MEVINLSQQNDFQPIKLKLFTLNDTVTTTVIFIINDLIEHTISKSLLTKLLNLSFINHVRRHWETSVAPPPHFRTPLGMYANRFANFICHGLSEMRKTVVLRI